MKHPIHPRRIVRLDRLWSLGLSVTKAAKVLGVTRQALNKVANEKAGISPEMAIRLSKALASPPETWLCMQAAFDLAVALKGENDVCVDRYTPQPVVWVPGRTPAATVLPPQRSESHLW